MAWQLPCHRSVIMPHSRQKTWSRARVATICLAYCRQTPKCFPRWTPSNFSCPSLKRKLVRVLLCPLKQKINRPKKRNAVIGRIMCRWEDQERSSWKLRRRPIPPRISLPMRDPCSKRCSQTSTHPLPSPQTQRRVIRAHSPSWPPQPPKKWEKVIRTKQLQTWTVLRSVMWTILPRSAA